MKRLSRVVRQALAGATAGSGGLGAFERSVPAAQVLTQEDVRVRDIQAEWRRDADQGLLYTIPWRELTPEERMLSKGNYAVGLEQHDAVIAADLKERGFAQNQKLG